MTKKEALDIITPFYNLFRSELRDWDEGFAVLDDNWRSYYTNDDYRMKADTKPYLEGLFEIVPDIHVEIQHLSVDGEYVTVRSQLSGTPVKDFMVAYSGNKFSIMTIDINRIQNGKITELYHLEDWGTAQTQLSAVATTEASNS